MTTSVIATHPWQDTLNRLLWAAGFGLQLGLLVALVVRRLWRRCPAFTLLVAFYIVRTAVLYGLARHLAAAPYALLYEGLSWLDLLLQLAVAVEIALAAVRQWGRRVGGRVLGAPMLSGAMLGMVAFAVCGAWLAPALLKAPARIPVYRGQIFISCLMILLFGWTLWLQASRTARRIAGGLAVYGLASLTSQAARDYS